MSAGTLLLVSSSTVHGSGYLDLCEAEARALFAGAGRILFVPYALADWDAYAAKARARFAAMGLRLDGIHAEASPADALAGAGGVFIGGGNTFRLLEALHAKGLVEPIRARVRAGMPYMGASAGSNVACPTIKTTNDMPIVEPPTFEALGLVPFQINPHYLDPDPTSTHLGETRETRIREYHEMNDLPVLGLREGAMVRVRPGEVRLLGTAGARLFRRGEPPVEHRPGDRLEGLLGA